MKVIVSDHDGAVYKFASNTPSDDITARLGRPRRINAA